MGAQRVQTWARQRDRPSGGPRLRRQELKLSTYSRKRVPDLQCPGKEFGTLAATYDALAARLEQTDSTRRRMLGELAHEMRNPLATIDAHLEALEDGVRDLDEATLGVIRGSTRRLRGLAEDIAAVSRAEEGNLELTMEPVHAARLAQAAGQGALGRFAAKGVHLHVEADTAERIVVDPERIGHVLGKPARQRALPHPLQRHRHAHLPPGRPVGGVRGRRHRRGHRAPTHKSRVRPVLPRRHDPRP